MAVKYDHASNRSYAEWVSREAALRDVDEKEIHKMVEVEDFRFWVQKGGLGREDPVMGSRVEFGRLCEKFDVVVNFSEETLEKVIIISGTGITWKEGSPGAVQQ